MHLQLDFSPAEEARLSIAVQRAGVTPAALIKRLVEEHLSALPTVEEDLYGSPQVLSPDIASNATLALLAEWAEEDTQVTEEERAENNRIYEEIERNGIPRLHLQEL